MVIQRVPERQLQHQDFRASRTFGLDAPIAGRVDEQPERAQLFVNLEFVVRSDLPTQPTELSKCAFERLARGRSAISH
jgi:hypothetical protein